MSLFLSFSNDELDIEFGKLAGQMHLGFLKIKPSIALKIYKAIKTLLTNVLRERE